MQFTQSIAGIADGYLPELSAEHSYNIKPMNSSRAGLQKEWKEIWNTLNLRVGVYIHEKWNKYY